MAEDGASSSHLIPAVVRKGPVILYDGDCGFCARVVIFVAERDPGVRFRFAPLQSDFGGAVLREAGISTVDTDTMVLVDADGIHTRSSAALRIAAGLERPWPLARFLLLIPRTIRDFGYNVIARNRHRLLPAPDRCMLPSQLEGRMLDAAP